MIVFYGPAAKNHERKYAKMNVERKSITMSKRNRTTDDFNRITSFSCGPTYDIVTSTLVHAHPVKRGFPKYPTRWIMVRAKGGISEAVYEVEKTIECYPEEIDQLDSEYRERIKRYADTRRASYGFATKDKPYRFYVLKVAYELNPPFVMQPNIQGYKYYELDEVINP